MLDPTPARFQALARSSPWRWRSLRFVTSWTDVDRPARDPVRARVRRPGRLRVETLDGQLRQATVDPGPVRITGAGPVPTGPVSPPDADAPAPRFDSDGFVAERPWGVSYDDPMFRDYRWVAMLDPVELADGYDRHGEDDGAEPVAALIDEVRALSHERRPAWEAVLRPVTGYFPRCPCCPLLPSAASVAALTDDGRNPYPGLGPDLHHADAHRVRLDVGTGVCVFAEEIGGSRPGAGHTVRIEAVDEQMDDAWFESRRRR